MIIIIIKIKRPNGEAPEISRRPKAGQQGGFGGGQRPPDTIIHYNRKFRRSARASPPANGRPAGGVQGAQRPPAQNHTTTTTFTVTVTVTIIIIFYNLNKAGWSAGLYTEF